MRIVVASVEPFAAWSYAWSHAGDTGSRPSPDGAPQAGAEGPPPLACSRDGRTVTHADPAARRRGVRSGMSVAGARQRVPDLVVVAEAGPEVDAGWSAFLDDLHHLSPRVLEVRTGVAAFAGDAHDAAAFAERTGARVGVADTVEEAHLLAYTADGGRAVVVPPGGDPWTRLDAAPVYLACGVGLATDDRRRLDWLGVDTLGHLRAWSTAQLAAFLGPDGAALRPYLHGPRTGRLPLRTPPSVAAAAHAFDDPAHEPYQIDPVLERLVDRAVRELGDRSAARVRMVATAAGMTSDAVRRAKEPLRDVRTLRNLARLALHDTHLLPFGLSGLRIELSGLIRHAVPEGLWPGRRRRQEAARAVHERFPGQARRFALHDPDALRPGLRWRLLDAVSGEEVRGPDDVPVDARPDRQRDGRPTPERRAHVLA